MKQKQTPAVWSILGILGCAVLYVVLRRIVPSFTTALLWIFGIAAVLIALLVALVLFAAFHKPKKTPEQEIRSARDEVLKKARLTLTELRTTAVRVRNRQIQDSAQRICATLEQILQTLQTQPEDLPKARSFLNHSLPMLSGILRKYSRLEQSGIPTDEVTAQTALCLQDLEAAAEKQYENLFDNDIVDITAEMEVLTQHCRRNGLLEEEATR